MKTKFYLSVFKAKSISRYDTFLSIDTNGIVTFDLTKVKLRNWRKALQLKKDAITLYKRFSYDNPFEKFCKSYPEIDWNVSFELKAGQYNKFTISCDYPYTLEQVQEKIRSYCAIPADEFHLSDDLGYYIKLIEQKKLENKINRAGIYLGENAVILNNGKYLVSGYDGTRHLKFVVSPNLAEFLPFSNNEELEKSINIIWENSPMFMYGNYKRSEKGTPLFYPCAKSNAKHILIKMETKKMEVYQKDCPIENNVYYEFKTPYIFMIINNGFKLEYDEESI